MLLIPYFQNLFSSLAAILKKDVLAVLISQAYLIMIFTLASDGNTKSEAISTAIVHSSVGTLMPDHSSRTYRLPADAKPVNV